MSQGIAVTIPRCHSDVGLIGPSTEMLTLHGFSRALADPRLVLDID